MPDRSTDVDRATARTSGRSPHLMVELSSRPQAGPQAPRRTTAAERGSSAGRLWSRTRIGGFDSCQCKRRAASHTSIDAERKIPVVAFLVGAIQAKARDGKVEPAPQRLVLLTHGDPDSFVDIDRPADRRECLTGGTLQELPQHEGIG